MQTWMGGKWLKEHSKWKRDSRWTYLTGSLLKAGQGDQTAPGQQRGWGWSDVSVEVLHALPQQDSSKSVSHKEVGGWAVLGRRFGGAWLKSGQEECLSVSRIFFAILLIMELYRSNLTVDYSLRIQLSSSLRFYTVEYKAAVTTTKPALSTDTGRFLRSNLWEAELYF